MLQKILIRECEGLRDVNMVPLIDVSLVLVTILLVASPMTFESSLAVREARAAAADAVVPSQGKPIVLHVVSEDSVEVEEMKIERAGLGPRLQALLATRAAARVVVCCEDSVSHGAFVNVLDEAKLSGAAEIAVVGR